MPSTAKIVIALTVVAAVSTAIAAPSPAGADPRPHHVAKHHRHPHPHHGARGQPLRLAPGEHPGYRYGVPLYSTCDRINADRMLVGTCR